MKDLHSVSVRFVSLFFAVAVLCGSLHLAFAQVTSTQAADTAPFVTETILLRNIRPDMMAYWIDPANQPVPSVYQNALSLSHLSRDQINQYIPQIKVFENSFHGQVIAAINVQNSLIISGSQDDLNQDKKIITDMDKPLQQVEIEGLILSADSTILKTIPTVPLHLLNAEPKDPVYSIALMTEDADALVKQLQTSGKIKLVDGPRVTTLDNLPASIGQSTTTPIDLEIKQTPGLYLPFNSIGDNQIGLETESTMKAIPTVNADGTITISLTLSFDASLVDYKAQSSEMPLSKDQPGSIFIKSLNNGPLTFDFTVKDNQSVLVRGIDSLFKLGKFHPSPMIFILTVHVLHRSDRLM